MNPTSSLALDSSIIIRHMRTADPAIAAQLKCATELYVPLSALGEIRQVADRNAGSVRRTRGGAKDVPKRAPVITRGGAPSGGQGKRRPRSNGA